MLEQQRDLEAPDAPSPTSDRIYITGSGNSDPAIDLAAAGRLLWAKRKQILATTLGTTVVAAVVAVAIPPYYKATASFIPPSLGSNPSAGLVASMGSLGASGLLGSLKNSGDLFVAILKSRSVADRLTDRFDLVKVYGEKKRSLAEKDLAKKSTFESDPKSSVVTVSVTDKQPTRARDLANAYIEEMRAQNATLALTESSQRRLFFEQQLAKEKNELADAEVALKKSQEASGLISPSGQTMSQIQALAGLRAQIQGREVQLAALRQSATEQNPEFIRLRSEIADLQGQLARMQNGKTRTDAEGIPTSQVPAVELEYVRKARDVKYHESLFEIIAKQYEAARLDEANNSPVLQVLDAAITPDTKAGPHRSIILGAGLVFGFIAGAVWVLFRARIRQQ